MFGATAAATAPNTPSDLMATNHNSATDFAEADSKLDLTWTDNSTDETSFELERSLSVDSGYIQVVTLPADTTSYIDSNLEEGTLYYYRIRACIGSTCSDYYTMPWESRTLLKPPTNLTANLSGRQVDLTWADNSQKETQYVVERAEGLPGSLVASDFHSIVDNLEPNTTSYSDTTVLPGGKTYSYLVYAVNLNNGTMSWYSNWPSIITQALEVIKSASSNRAAPGDILTFNIEVINHSAVETLTNVSVTDAVPNLTNFISADNDGENLNGIVTWNLPILMPSEAKTVSFRVKVKGPPNAPSNLIAQPVSSSEVNLTWQDNSDNEYSFIVEFSTNSDFSDSVQVWGAANVTTMPLNGLNPQTKYYFRVAAYDLQLGNSSWSNTAEATTF